ncbi:RecX family transcriptional regulator [Tyzzerella sp. OttesenSCG-928-J15]|nr:RecX family transcriptional regulator [Tyzzerella sp. OttesenSCG-928-J15]
MIITAIEEQKKNKERRSIFVDGEFAFGMSVEDVYFYRLKEGLEISEEYFEEIKTNVIVADGKNKALKYLSYSAKTKKEMLKKLKTYDFSPDIIDEVIAFLEEHNFINDYDYAEKFAESRRRAGYGEHRIKSELYIKGISGDVIEDVLEKDDDDDEDETVNTILKLLEKKIKSDTKEEFYENERQKIYGFLNRRGFGFDDVKVAIQRYWEEHSL